MNSAKDKMAQEDLLLEKADINRLEAKIIQGFKDQRKWMIILMLVCASLIVFVVKFT